MSLWVLFYIPVHIRHLKLMEIFTEFKLSPRKTAFYFASVQVLFTFYNWLLNQSQQLAIHTVTENNSPSPSFSRGALLPYLEYACMKSIHYWGQFYLLLLIQNTETMKTRCMMATSYWVTLENSSELQLFIFKIGIIMAFSNSCKTCNKEVCNLHF